MLPGYAAQRGHVQLALDQQHVQKAKPQLVILLNLFERKTKPYQAILNKPIRSRLGEAFLSEIRKSERGVVNPYTSFQGTGNARWRAQGALERKLVPAVKSSRSDVNKFKSSIGVN